MTGAGVAAGLEAALRLRAPAIYASTPAVRVLARLVGDVLGSDQRELELVDLSVRVRDVGMVGLPDAVVLSTSTISPQEWEVLATHPLVGADLLASFDELVPVAAVVRSHHERWDGDGYPDGLRGTAIPLASRVIAACDAFVAIAEDRPHRRGLGRELALERVCAESARQFDPRVTAALLEAVSVPGATQRAAGTGRTRRRPGTTKRVDAAAQKGGVGGLGPAISELAALPAFAPAVERALAITAAGDGIGGDLVAAVESDLGLTIALIREAQRSQAGQITSVPDALIALDVGTIHDVIAGLPRAAFPWQTKWERRLQQARLHAQAVARATERIAQELGRDDRDSLLTIALVHDVGKLVLARARSDYGNDMPEGTTTPEQRLRLERREFHIDHASVGGVVLERWGLAAPLLAAVRSHHSAEATSDVAAVVRLADSVVHYVQGDAVDTRVILLLATGLGLDSAGLRRVLFDLPHGGGSQRRRSTPSTLSAKETVILRLVAQGKLAKQVAAEIGLSASTVRTHLHNIYIKLNVDDKAQAVLRATELAWI